MMMMTRRTGSMMRIIMMILKTLMILRMTCRGKWGRGVGWFFFFWVFYMFHGRAGGIDGVFCCFFWDVFCVNFCTDIYSY
jgi:hypothetical protein